MTLEKFKSDLILADDILIFDYDGTLSDFVADPMQAVVPPQVVKDLEAISKDHAVIVISGRQVAELDRFLSPLKLPVSGAHGRQFRGTGGSAVESPPLPDLPQPVRDLAHQLAAKHTGAHIEIKDENSFGFHVRPMQLELRQVALDEFRDAATRLLVGTAYKLQLGNMVAEVCPAGFDKGQAVGRFLSMAAYAGKRAVYFGDDLTDEYAFRKLSEDKAGFGVLIGPRAFNPDTETAASYMLDSPAEMRALVHTLATQS